MRFSYDSTKLQPSNLQTNEITTDETEYFKFEDEFKDSLELFTIPYDGTGEGIRAVTSFNPPVTATEHIIDKEGIGKVINTDGGVLLGKMSFQMTTDERFKTDWFSLVENPDSSPEKGIKININGKQFFEKQSTFRFTDGEVSPDLTNLIASRGEKNEENPENATYKEYTLTPTFDKETTNYQTEILEYVDDIDITAIPTDEYATMKIKVPKRDENNNLIYEADGVTPQYEEKDLQNGVPLNVKLNTLGAEPDTVIKVIVTAADEVTTKEYELVVKRPYATIKGSVYTEPTVYTTGKHIAEVLLYKTEDTKKTIDWEEAINHDKQEKADELHKELIAISEVAKQKTQDDGTFEIFVIPGEYDLLINKEGYVDHVVIQITVAENEVKELEQANLISGDVNKDGVVEILDKVLITKQNGTNSSLPDFMEECDLNDDGSVEILDKTIVTKSNGKRRTIINKGGNT